MLKDEINIIKELPPYMKSIYIEAIGSLVCYLFSSTHFVWIICILSEYCLNFSMLFSDYWCRYHEGGHAHWLHQKSTSSPHAEWNCSLPWIWKSIRLRSIAFWASGKDIPNGFYFWKIILFISFMIQWYILEFLTEIKVQMQLPCIEVCAENSASWCTVGQKDKEIWFQTQYAR